MRIVYFLSIFFLCFPSIFCMKQKQDIKKLTAKEVSEAYQMVYEGTQNHNLDQLKNGLARSGPNMRKLGLKQLAFIWGHNITAQEYSTLYELLKEYSASITAAAIIASTDRVYNFCEQGFFDLLLERAELNTIREIKGNKELLEDLNVLIDNLTRRYGSSTDGEKKELEPIINLIQKRKKKLDDPDVQSIKK